VELPDRLALFTQYAKGLVMTADTEPHLTCGLLTADETGIIAVFTKFSSSSL
jgi:hypothetical protein